MECEAAGDERSIPVTNSPLHDLLDPRALIASTKTVEAIEHVTVDPWKMQNNDCCFQSGLW